ncbi:MAG: helix-turn-helix domain-containing protein [Planctomycetota bacterium]|jgi:transcriptional regulator with XRE-family HTH domain
MFAERLRTARKQTGLSLRAVQKKIGNKVTAQAIGKYERGAMKPSDEILKVLSDALGVSSEFLTSPSRVKLGEIDFRENFIRNKRDAVRIKAELLNHIEKYLELEETLQIETLEWIPPRDFPFPVDEKTDIEMATQLIRSDWKLGDDPISNLTELLENRGIKVVYLDLPSSVSGISCFIERIGDKKVPTITIELISLKKIFGVSILSIPVRCKAINMISSATYQKMYKDFIRRGWTSPPFDEPHELINEESKRFERLCYRAVAEDLLTLDKASRYLNISAKELEKQMNY